MALLQPEKGTAITIVIEFINIVISTEPKAFYWVRSSLVQGILDCGYTIVHSLMLDVTQKIIE